MYNEDLVVRSCVSLNQIMATKDLMSIGLVSQNPHTPRCFTNSVFSFVNEVKLKILEYFQEALRVPQLT